MKKLINSLKIREQNIFYAMYRVKRFCSLFAKEKGEKNMKKKALVTGKDIIMSVISCIAFIAVFTAIVG